MLARAPPGPEYTARQMHFDSRPFELHCAAHSDIGRMRRRNEDHYVCDSTLRLLAIADGMGGHAAGDVASRLAVQTLCDRLHGEPDSPCTPSARLRAAIETANIAIHLAAADSQQLGMGTTIVTAWFVDGAVLVAHVGDSRLYRLRGDELVALTRDHSWVQDMIDRGLYTPERARTSPRRNQLLRALGSLPDVEIDLAMHALRAGDRYLLCSDGLNGMLDDAEIAALLGADATPQSRVQRLIDSANARGGRDNVTVAIADVLER